MDKAQLKELNDIADSAAAAAGCGASVQAADLLPSEVQSVGLRLVLSVFRMVNGQLLEESKNYRPERADLGAAIEQDARDMALRLQSARR
ncbi:MAG TPA: hypothetical protein VFO23_05440 [Steroidobacteraceae bacterium]|nr:hypothetical protein [Steroidobacteraceae bacterium]